MIVLLCPTQIAGGVADAVTTGNGLTVTVVLAVAVQPKALVTVTVYVVVATGLTVVEDVVAPLVQRYEPPPVADNVVL